MSAHPIESGQVRLATAGETSKTVLVLAQAVVPFGYWICQNQDDGQQRIVAATSLAHIPDDSAPLATEAALAV